MLSESKVFDNFITRDKFVGLVVPKKKNKVMIYSVGALMEVKTKKTQLIFFCCKLPLHKIAFKFNFKF